MIQLLENIFAIEVPDVAINFEIRSTELSNKLKYEKYHTIRLRPLPPGSYEILFTTKDCTEEQAAGVVEREDGYNAYKEYERDGPWVNEIAVNSLQSLLRSKSLDPAKNYLLIRAAPQKEDK